MTWSFSPYTGVLFFAAGLAVAMALLVRRRQATLGSAPFFWLMLAMTEWTFTAALETAVMEPEAKILWSKISYLGIASVAPLWLTFALEYGRQNRWRRRDFLTSLWFLPLITLSIAATNEWHGWLWKNITPSTSQPGALLIYAHGPWFWVTVVYTYALLLTGAIVLMWAVLHSRALYRLQALTLLVGVVIPWIANAIYVLGLSPWPGLDLTPLAFTLSGLICALSLFRFQLFALGPIARDVLVENMWDGVLVLDTQGRIVDMNTAAERLLGIQHTLIGEAAETALAVWPALAARCQYTQEVQDVELAVDDPPRYIAAHITPLYDRTTRFAGRLIVLQDITQRKQTEAQLHLQSVALEAAPNGIVITHRDGNIIWVNPAFTRLTGYAAPEVVGRNPRLLKSDKHDTHFYQLMWNTILSGKIWQGELINRRKDGEFYFEEQIIAPVRDEQGAISHFIAIKQDISERKQLEQIRQDLTHTLVHDLRNPLNNISIALEILGKKGPAAITPEQHDILGIIRSSAERMSGLVNDILDISRLEAGQLPLERKPVALAALVAETLQLQKPLAMEKQLHMENAVPPELPKVSLDSNLIGRVLQNLVSNAIKFTPPGGVICVKAQMAEADTFLLISVSDNGQGIPPELQSRLFQKFVTGQMTESGSGLGLAFCRLAIEAHGGRIWLDSEPGCGTTFTFILPMPSQP